MSGSQPIRRRTFLAGAAGLAGAAALSARRSPAAAAALPGPGSSGIDHIVLVMMENRSFDHYLGWLPGADGKQAGLSYTDSAGVSHPTYHLTTYQGCDHPDPDHSYAGGRVEYDNGLCDGWLRAGANDTYAIGYYTDADLAFHANAAPYWTAFDRYFAATMAETYPNRFYQHSAQTDRVDDSTAIATMPTIWDLLASAGVSHRYYFSDVPFLALYGTRYLPISATYPQFLADAAAGTLPAVSFVDPRFEDESSGTSADDHPHADIRAGQYFLNQVYQAVTGGPLWPRTALIINYDEWGGFFDHVPPGTAPDPRPDLGTGLRGFRTPCLLISPLAQRHYVAHGVYDHTSVLKMIEWRWSLPSLTVRDAAAANLAEVLDFTSPPDLTAPRWDVPAFTGLPCTDQQYLSAETWSQLAALAQAAGWPVGG
ncbi:MAG: alkaline phosphatase family protein [Gemmatimonadota bacterium]